MLKLSVQVPCLQSVGVQEREAARVEKRVRVSWIQKAPAVELGAARTFTRRAPRDPSAPVPRGAAVVPEVLPVSLVPIPERVLLLEKSLRDQARTTLLRLWSNGVPRGTRQIKGKIQENIICH